MDRYLMAIDNGLTATKAVIYSLEGKEIASSVAKTEIEVSGDFAEINMEAQWKKTAKVISEAIQKAEINPSSVIGIGNSGHGAGLYSVDDSLKPVRNAILSMDGRVSGIISRWTEEGRSNFGRVNHEFWNGQQVPLLYWLKINEPENYHKMHKVFSAKDWIKLRLTGKVTTEYTDASNSGVVNLWTKNYDREIFSSFDVDEAYDKMPELRLSTDIAGYVSRQASEETGLAEGTPVIGGLFDCIACALGSGVYNSGQYGITAGTWNINLAIEDDLIKADDTIKCSFHPDKEKYVYVESSATSAVNLDWCVNNILDKSQMDSSRLYRTIDTEIAGFKPDEVDILYMPFIYKSKLAKNLDGGFWGIKAAHNTYHLMRAVYEGIVFAHLRHLENLKRKGIVKSKASLSGGASNSEIWCHLFADILNVEITTTQSSQIGALGMAICTAAALGEYKSLEEAVKKMVKVKNTYIPDAKANNSYMDKYKKFTKIIELFDNNF